MDIQNSCIADIKRLAFVRLPYIPLLLLCLWYFVGNKDYNKPLYTIFIYGIIVAVLFILAMFAVYSYKVLNPLLKTNKGEYEIKTDKLLYSEKKDPGYLKAERYGMAFAYMLSKPYRLYFTSYDEYQIPKGDNYKWSQMYSMSSEGVFNCAIDGDEYYLVVIDNKKAILAYNTKHFELRDK